MRQILVISAALALSMSSLALGQLAFDQAEQEVTPSAQQKQEKAATQQFTFTNTGPAPVTVRSIRASEGCVAELLKKTYLPGEQGGVVVTSEVDPAMGPYRKTVILETDDRDQPTIRLVSHVKQPHPVALSAPVSWTLREATAPKVITALVNYAMPVRLLAVRSNDPRLSVQLSTILEGQSYAITVTPVTTDEAISAIIDIETDLMSKGRPRVLRTCASVVPQEQ